MSGAISWYLSDDSVDSSDEAHVTSADTSFQRMWGWQMALLQPQKP